MKDFDLNRIETHSILPNPRGLRTNKTNKPLEFRFRVRVYVNFGLLGALCTNYVQQLKVHDKQKELMDCVAVDLRRLQQKVGRSLWSPHKWITYTYLQIPSFLHIEEKIRISGIILGYLKHKLKFCFHWRSLRLAPFFSNLT